MFLFFQSKIYTRTPTIYLDFKLKGGAKHMQPVPKGKEVSNVCMYFIVLNLLSRTFKKLLGQRFYIL